MRELKSVLIAILGLAVGFYAAAGAVPTKRDAHIGYVVPAGGQQSTTFEVIVGGQFLRTVHDVHIFGQGVSAKVIKHYTIPRFNFKEERQELIRRLVEAKEMRLDELGGSITAPPLPGEWMFKKNKNQAMKNEADSPDVEPVQIPEHPLLRDLESKSLRELQHIANTFLDWEVRGKQQQNAQLREILLVEVTIDADATPGYRELRVSAPRSTSNPVAFQIGTLREVHEMEPNDPDKFEYLPDEAPEQLPFVMNGQIMPGDVDRFRFEAHQGQRLVINAHARRLVPFLADAVPGWFQAVLTLYDSEGRELAFVDDYQFHPDPVIFYEVPKDGVYELEIRDSIYRGREDFVYRVAVGEQPFITDMFPLGGRAGAKTVASIGGWNLPIKRLKLNTSPGDETLRQTMLHMGKAVSNEVTYAVDTLPEFVEDEPNNNVKRAQKVKLPRIINGRIDEAGDVDVYKFKGHAGDEVVAEVIARRLHSPMDSVIRLADSSGRVIEWNDDHTQRAADYLHPDMGLLTHHADSWLNALLPKDGTYYVTIADAQTHGGKAYAYRLRLSAPRPDFELRVTPSSLSLSAGRSIPVTVHALRKDEFDGEIAIFLKDAPKGFELAGAVIPSGRDSVRMTLKAPGRRLNKAVALNLQGQAIIDGNTVTRSAIPCENVMQAFLFRHLAPSREFVVAVTGGWAIPALKLAGESPVRVPVGGSAEVLLTGIKERATLIEVSLELQNPASGMTLADAQITSQGLAFHLNMEGHATKAGFADNAIIEVFTQIDAKSKGENAQKAPVKKRRVSLGVLPAIPYVLVEP